MPSSVTSQPGRFQKVYQATVRNPWLNNAVLGLLGLWGFYSSLSRSQSQPAQWWLAGVITLGGLAIICAVQALLGSPRVEVMCTWRLLLTFYSLFGFLDHFSGLKHDLFFGCVIGIAYICLLAFVWRRSFANSWGAPADDDR